MSPVGFSGSGIYPFWSLGFGILKKYGREIQDCIYGSYAEFSVIMKWDSGNCALKRRDPGFQMVKILLSYLQPPL